MNTKQHNLNPVERTFCASRLLGRSGRRRFDRGYLGQGHWLVLDTNAGMPNSHGLEAVDTGIAILA